MHLKIPPPLQALLCALAMWLTAAVLPDLIFRFAGQFWLALMFIMLGASIDLLALLSFIRHRTTVSPLQPGEAAKLVTSGLFARSRNPMYLGLALVLTGWVIYLGQPANLLWLVVFVAWITVFQIKPEEAVLSAKFGSQYEDYAARVRRWF